MIQFGHKTFSNYIFLKYLHLQMLENFHSYLPENKCYFLYTEININHIYNDDIVGCVLYRIRYFGFLLLLDK